MFCFNSIKVGKFGRHGYDTSVLQIVNPWLGWTLITENWLSTVTLGIAKLTFLLFYLTLFSPNRILRYMIYFGMVVTILVFLGFTLAQTILLVPHPGENWLEMYQDPREMAVLKISVPISVTSFIVDIYTFIIPITGVSGLKLSPKRKIGVLIVFITGL
ncbi:hypothetical protein EAE99_011827 [Botrytis elliptica]|nr:hypothetical protein EAE99_011827 [Botrytis elliptica]